MDVYIARQPIFDRGENIFGYELLYQNNETKQIKEEGKEAQEGSSKETAAHALYTAFFVMQFDELTGRTRGFLKFSEDLLVRDIPQAIPKDRIVIEVLNPSSVTEEFIHACKTLRASGYILALDNFDPENGTNSMLEHVDIVKVNFKNVPLDVQRRLIKQYGDRLRFLSKKLDTSVKTSS